MDKYDKEFQDVAPDGKQEIVEGSEPLKKEPKKKKKKHQEGVIVERWDGLKKALDNAKSILDLREEAKEEPEEQPEEAEQAQPQAQAQAPDEAPAPEEPAPPAPGEQQEAQPEEEGDDEQANPDDEAEEQKLIESLKDQGYSDAEIAYVVHGHHAPDIDVAKDAKAKATQAMSGIETGAAEAEAQQKLDTDRKMGETELEHKKRMADLEYKKSEMEMPDPEMDKKHKQRMMDLEYEMKRAQMKDSGPEKEHSKRMADLEYEGAKAHMPNPKHKQRMEDVEYESAKASMPNNEFETEHKKKMMELEYNFEKEAKKLELEFKKKEHAQNLKLAEAGMKQKAKEGDAKHKVRLAEAKKPKPKTALKKHDDDPEGEPYEGELHYEDCEDPDCHGCGVDEAPYNGDGGEDSEVNKDDAESPYSKESKRIQRIRNQGADARAAQRAVTKPFDYSGAPSISTPYVNIRDSSPQAPAPKVPSVPNTLKTDSKDPSNTPSFQNKALRDQQRVNRENAEEESHDLPAKPDSVMPTKYVDIGTRPTPATPATHPKLR